MRSKATSRRCGHPGFRDGFRRAVAGLQLLLFLFVLLLAILPELHHHIHEDAHDEAHECAVTLLLSGSIDLADTAVEPEPVTQAEWALVFPGPSAPAVRPAGESWARGPPES